LHLITLWGKFKKKKCPPKSLSLKNECKHSKFATVPTMWLELIEKKTHTVKHVIWKVLEIYHSSELRKNKSNLKTN